MIEGVVGPDTGIFPDFRASSCLEPQFHILAWLIPVTFVEILPDVTGLGPGMERKGFVRTA